MALTSPVAAQQINFMRLAVDAGSVDGGRTSFEKLVKDVVTVANRSARRLASRGGDWGIDTYVGELDGGHVAVWQAKYFVDGVGSAQQAQIRGSLASVVQHASTEGFTLAAWTLCIPCELDAAAARWWEGFSRRKAYELKIEIGLWDESELRLRLMSSDCAHVRDGYFGQLGLARPRPLPIEPLSDPHMYDRALFVAQLHEAGITEDSSAKLQFFNAELLSHEVVDKGVTEELEELQQRRAEVHAIWEIRFNKHNMTDTDDVLPGLHPEVMLAVEAHHTSTPPRRLRAGLIHTLGLMHQHVEEHRAGWIRKWRQIADALDA